MTDVTAQNPQPASYVDDYAPPANHQMTSDLPSAAQADTVPGSPSTVSNSGDADTSEAIEDQNIFVLLGIDQATDEEKETFLDELQQVIWEDFVEKDVELLLTEDELKEFRSLSSKDGQTEEERQTKMIEYLEKLIPDLEKIMLEKAIELKEQMTVQRIREYMAHFQNDDAKLEEVKKAQSLADEMKWRSVSEVLNKIEV